MRTLLAATGIAAAATIVGVGAYAAQSSSLDATSPTASTSIAVDDNGGLTDRDDRVEPGDDNGGLTDRDDRVEPGDDRDSGDGGESGDDGGNTSGDRDDDWDGDWDDRDSDDWDDDHDDD